MTPAQRSLAHLRKQGMLAGVVEKWNPHVGIRQDLFGFADIVAVDVNAVCFVQTTSGSNLSARVEKMRLNPSVRVLAGNPSVRVIAHGWRKVGPKGKRKTWQLREVEVEPAPLPGESGLFLAGDV